VNEVRLSTILSQLAINRNRGTQKEFSVSKEILSTQQARVAFLTQECDVKINSVGLPDNLYPTSGFLRNPTLLKNLRLHNPGPQRQVFPFQPSCHSKPR